MISQKTWVCWRKRPALHPGPFNRKVNYRVVREGWYLFGFLPLFVRDLDVREVQ